MCKQVYLIFLHAAVRQSAQYRALFRQVRRLLQDPSHLYRVIKSLCAPDDYKTESYKQCSECPTPVSRHLLTRRTVFSKTVFSMARSTFRIYSVMAVFKSSIILYCNRKAPKVFLITLYNNFT